MDEFMEPIKTSFFEIFKVGPGPSSSHTIGPMNAALDFKKKIEKLPKKILKKVNSIKIFLYGSLSATGKGHGTDRAVLAGLMGWSPESCDVDKLFHFFEKKEDCYDLKFNGKVLSLDSDSFHFAEIHHLFPYSNTIVMKLFAKDKVILESEYYSVGGGFVECKGERNKDPVHPPYLYRNLSELKDLLKSKNISLNELLVENEMLISGLSKDEVFQKLFHVIDVMENAVDRGLNTEGVLPGPLKLERKAYFLHKRIMDEKVINSFDRFLVLLDAYALAAAEENAAGHLVVTAPTSGAAGVIPGIVYLLKNHFKRDKKVLAKGLLAAAMIGFVAKHNASISGAEVGCQGEIGVASAMGAAFLAHINDCSIDVVDNAAKIALKHFLGLTCDPLCGYVQIPCIERNAIAAVSSYNSYLLASMGEPKKQKLSFDQVVRVMLKTGRDMCIKYKETSRGGLALLDVQR
jgi:L-serine dehydratase